MTLPLSLDALSVSAFIVATENNAFSCLFPQILKPARQLSTCNQWAGIHYRRHFRKKLVYADALRIMPQMAMTLRPWGQLRRTCVAIVFSRTAATQCSLLIRNSDLLRQLRKIVRPTFWSDWMRRTLRMVATEARAASHRIHQMRSVMITFVVRCYFETHLGRKWQNRRGATGPSGYRARWNDVLRHNVYWTKLANVEAKGLINYSKGLSMTFNSFC